MGRATDDQAFIRTPGRGWRSDSVVDTNGDTPMIRIDRPAADVVGIYVGAEFPNPAASVKDRLAPSIVASAK